jgi:hypothetical protein
VPGTQAHVEGVQGEVSVQAARDLPAHDEPGGYVEGTNAAYTEPATTPLRTLALAAESQLRRRQPNDGRTRRPVTEEDAAHTHMPSR